MTDEMCAITDGRMCAEAASAAGDGADCGLPANAVETQAAADLPEMWERMEAKLTRLQVRRDAFEQRLLAGGLSAPCSVAGHGEARLDLEASFKARRAVYVCGLCVAEARLVRVARAVCEAGIPADVRHATLENFCTTRPNVCLGVGFMRPEVFVEKARLFARGKIRNLVLAGTPGIGKGHLAAALGMEGVRAGEVVRWVDCAALFSAYHQAYADGSMERVIRRYAEADLLVLDEVGLRPLPADGEEILYSILDARHKAARRCILLGNMPAQASREWIGSRLVDRLRSGGVAFCYGSWASMRGADGDGGGW